MEQGGIDRRRFLSLFGAAAAAAAAAPMIPFGRVWSFPKEIVLAQPCTVRFIRVWDPFQAVKRIRYDVLSGFAAHIPVPVYAEEGEAIEIVRESQMQAALDQLAAKYNAPAPRAKLLMPTSKEPQMHGVDYIDHGIHAVYGVHYVYAAAD